METVTSGEERTPGPIAGRHSRDERHEGVSITSTFATSRRSSHGNWMLPGLARLRRRALHRQAPYEVFFGPPPPVDFFKAHPASRIISMRVLV
jgi:hypothetical protein